MHKLKEMRDAFRRRFDRLVMWMRDRRRGYTDADIASLKKKYREYKPVPGGIIKVTRAEMKALHTEDINYYDT